LNIGRLKSAKYDWIWYQNTTKLCVSMPKYIE
jgi:hypothetical protein